MTERNDPIEDALIAALSGMGPRQADYVVSLISWLEHDESGAIIEALKRHEKGERISDMYFDLESGETRHVAQEDRQLPMQYRPVLGPLHLHR